jgi:hypothetical protein
MSIISSHTWTCMGRHRQPYSNYNQSGLGQLKLEIGRVRYGSTNIKPIHHHIYYHIIINLFSYYIILSASNGCGNLDKWWTCWICPCCMSDNRILNWRFSSLWMIRGMRIYIPNLRQDRYDTFDELHLYCYRIAGTVGLMSMPIFGCAPGCTIRKSKRVP